MGWENCHLHAFRIAKVSYGSDPDGEHRYLRSDQRNSAGSG